MDIAEALQAKGYEIDRRKIVLREPIKETGEYTVNVKLHRDVVLQVPVRVTGEGGEMPEPKVEKKARKAKAESEEAPVEDATSEPATDVEAPAAEASEA
jgi:large subunit ribosomal protein L9